MAVVENRFVCDLSKPVQAQALKGNVFSLDNLGSRISVLIYDNGQPATISGSVTANCILPDGSTVNVNGGLTTENGGSKTYVDVPQSCLLIPGILKIAIKCTSSSVITTLAAIVANVYMTKTDNVITPSQQIINDWNDEISAAIATQNAAIANQDTKINDLKSALFTKAEEAYLLYPSAGSNNRFNKNAIITGYYVNSDGSLAVSADFWCSELIPVKPSSNYYKNAICAFYDKNGNFIPDSYTVSSTYNVTSPATAKYARLSRGTSMLDVTFFYEGAYNKTFDNFNPKFGMEQIESLQFETAVNNIILPQIDDFLVPSVHSPNLFDKSTITEGYYLNSDGNPVAASGWFYSDKIYYNITPGATYSKYGICSVYKANGEHIQQFAASVASFEMPANAAYCRMSRTLEYVDVTYLIKGTTVTSDLYYYKRFGRGQIDLPQEYIVDINGNGDFTSLTACVKAHADEKCDIFVKNGVYDLYTEFSDVYGTDFTYGTHVYEGILVDKGKRFFLDPLAVIKFEYTGSVENIIKYFSPFKFSGKGGEIHGGQIVASNCRYAIHDDVYAYSTGPSISITDGVMIDFNNPSRNVCIGGGMGPCSDVTVQNCIIKQTNDGSPTAIFYHNADEGQAQGRIRITNNYCDNGKIYVQSFGETIKTTTALVTGNKCYSVTHVDGDITNMELIAYNNDTTV